MAKQRILVVDDEANARAALRTILSEEGYEISEAADGEEGLARIEEWSPDLVLADVRMPRMNGLALLRKAKETGAEASFIMMTAFASIETAVEAVKAGAENYLVKPLDVSAVLVFIAKALEKRQLVREAASLRERVRERFRLEGMVGESPELAAVYNVVRQAAPTKATVLILGESGTGKELIAQALHELSPRKDKPFVKVSCAALSETLLESELFGHERGSFTGAVGRKEGRFELADGGTLFLDEIGEISPSIQTKLLRVLQEKELQRVGGEETLKVDVRVVAATNRDLKTEVQKGRFREDLFYRLHIVPLSIPPLRERPEDIPALARHFVLRFAARMNRAASGISEPAMRALQRYPWPGNVRELENAVEQSLVFSEGPELAEEDLPAFLRGPAAHKTAGALPVVQGDRSLPEILEDLERQLIQRAYDRTGGVKTETARALGIKTSALYYKLEKYGIGVIAGRASGSPGPDGRDSEPVVLADKPP
ncbi:MAG: sigma-54-dependent transcriptional regulator, partial [Myxococcales bacterium]